MNTFVDADLAEEIMGKNYFGVDRAIRHFGVEVSDKQRDIMNQIPFSEDVLKHCKEKYLLAAVFPISIIGMEKRLKGVEGIFYEQGYYEDPKNLFAHEAGSMGWILVAKNGVQKSASKSWASQLAMINGKGLVPSAQGICYVAIGHFLQTGQRIFSKKYMRTSSVGPDGNHVCVGAFATTDIGEYDTSGIDVNDVFNDTPSAGILLAFAMKPNIIL